MAIVVLEQDQYPRAIWDLNSPPYSIILSSVIILFDFSIDPLGTKFPKYDFDNFKNSSKVVRAQTELPSLI